MSVLTNEQSEKVASIASALHDGEWRDAAIQFIELLEEKGVMVVIGYKGEDDTCIQLPDSLDKHISTANKISRGMQELFEGIDRIEGERAH